jgi:hypothetical protein
MRTDLVLDALRMALGQREPGADFALVAHTDRGSQYTSADYTQELDDHGVLASVGSVGDAYDNAMAESFVDTFKTELIADRIWRSRTQLELAVVEYVAWFNNDRLHESLADVSPAEFESLYVAQGSPTEQSLLNWNQLKRSPLDPVRLILLRWPPAEHAGRPRIVQKWLYRAIGVNRWKFANCSDNSVEALYFRRVIAEIALS